MAHFLGRRIAYTCEVVEHVPGERFVMRTAEGPFPMGTILEDHLAGPDDDVSSSLAAEPVRLSGLMTFFFGIFCLQWAINRHIVGGRQQVIESVVSR